MSIELQPLIGATLRPLDEDAGCRYIPYFMIRRSASECIFCRALQGVIGHCPVRWWVTSSRRRCCCREPLDSERILFRDSPIERVRVLKPKPHRLLTGVLLIIAAAGAAMSLYYGQQLRQLKREREALAKEVGLLDVTEPDRVHLTFVPPGDGGPPPGIEEAHVWRFRVYLPANFGPCWMSYRGAIAADSPRHRGGGGSSWGAKQKDPEESQLSVALIKADGRWIISRTAGHSSTTSSLPSNLGFDSLDDLVIETVVNDQTPAKSFSADEPICLIRIRKRVPVEQRKEDTTTMYPGLAFYLVESDRRAAFERWADGTIDAMPELIE